MPHFEKLTSFQEEDLGKALQLIQENTREDIRVLGCMTILPICSPVITPEYTMSRRIIFFLAKPAVLLWENRFPGKVPLPSTWSFSQISREFLLHMTFLSVVLSVEPVDFQRGKAHQPGSSEAGRALRNLSFRPSVEDTASEFYTYMESALAISKSTMPAASSEEVGQAVSAQVIISFTAFTILRLLEAKLDFTFSRDQIISSLLNYNCMQIAGNIYQFTYYDSLLAACEASLGLELHNKYRSQLQIRRLLRY